MDQGPQTPGARSRTFSFRSDKSGGSRPKESLTESPKEKQRRDSIWKSTSKANPNAALTEAQPGVNALLEETTIAPIRDQQHKDAYGNIITDPDLSNPTRPRMERPLDTIRSFEAAIDNGYKRRASHIRSESYEQNNGFGAPRRNSGYGFDSTPPATHRYTGSNGGGYYSGGRDSYGAPGPSGRPRYGRGMQSDPSMYHQRPYPPQHGHQASQDTVHTGMTNGSDSTGPWQSGTDPSSENSSIDKNMNGYGPNGYQNGAQYAIPEEGGAYPMRSGAPPVQPPAPNNARRPIPLGNTGGSPMMPAGGSLPSAKRPDPEKRKSWLKRRFSKKE